MVSFDVATNLPDSTGAPYRPARLREDGAVDFAATLRALHALIGREVAVSIGNISDATPMTAHFKGTLTRAHEFSPEVAGYIDPDVRDADVVAFMVGEQGEYPAWFFLAGERFEGARQMERDALVIVVGDVKLIVEPLDEPE